MQEEKVKQKTKSASITNRCTVWLVLIVITSALIFSTGCGAKPISRETLDYFYGLVNQQYWQRQAVGLTLNDEYGTEQLVVAPTGTSNNQQYVLFEDVTVTASNPKSGPIDAVIKIKVFDGTVEKEVRARVNDANRAMLEKMLAETFESKVQREQRLKDEEYAAKLTEADSLLAANKVADAIAALKAAQAINDTDEVKTRLDVIYLKQGKYYYSQKNYDVALEKLKLVSFDPASLKEAQELLPTVQADADKAAAAAKADAQRRTWFKTLDDYYWEYKDLCDEADQTPRYLLSPMITKLDTLQSRIVAYCASHTGMQPTELDGMRTALSGFVSDYFQSIDYFALGADYIDIEHSYYLKAEAHRAEYLRLRAIVAKRYGY
jgi:tetratricopeptide (TPR) repeat protein